VQVEINQVNAVTKDINLLIPSAEVDVAYAKFLKKQQKILVFQVFGKVKLRLIPLRGCMQIK